jgi:type IV secretory pathway VirB9-like protein
VTVDNDRDRCELVNFRYNDHFYIVDKLFERANLVNGFDDTAQIITILHEKPKRGFWSRLFG